jgi:hypothetical protein
MVLVYVEIIVIPAPTPIIGATIGTFAPMTYSGLAQTPSATVTIDGLTVTGTWSSVTNIGQTTTFTASGSFTGTISNVTISPAMQEADPTVNWPVGLTVPFGQMLSSITLPDNGTGTPGSFAWIAPMDTVGVVGINQHMLRFTPTSNNFGAVLQLVDVTVALPLVTVTVNSVVTGYITLTAAFDAISTTPGNYVVSILANQTIAPRTLDTDGVNITLAGAGANRSISLSAPGNMFMVSNGAALTLGNNITITGLDTNNFSLISVSSDGTLVMEDGATITRNYLATAVSVFNVRSDFVMNGGRIISNTSDNIGGGVHVSNGGSFTMNDGEISDNRADQGGGVAISGNSTFIINGGVITGNWANFSSNSSGGGVVVYSDSTFNMNGGEIRGNTAGSGGGVRISGTNAVLNISGNAAISGNVATSSTGSGGGVLVSGNETERRAYYR